MVNKAECYEVALQQVRNRRHRAIEQADKLREQIMTQHPQIAQIERELIALSKQQMFARINNDPKLETLIQEYDALHLKRSYELTMLGYSDKAFSPIFHCETCEDTGLDHGVYCECVKQIAYQKMLEQLCRDLPCESFCFENYSLDYFDNEDQKTMEKVFFDCQNYAKNFSLKSESLYLRGNTGLGKTHLTFAMAKEIVAKGFSVIYASAPTLVTELEKEHFGHSSEKLSEIYKGAQLLIIDDLGTEYLPAVAQSVLYHIIDHRILMQLPTIINSNLIPSELEQRYGDRLVSRILGCYRTIRFVGKDIRIQKMLASKKV